MIYDVNRRLTDLELKQKLDMGYYFEHGVYPPKDFWLLARPSVGAIAAERATRQRVQDRSIYRVCSNCSYMEIQLAFKQEGSDNQALRCPKCGMFNIRRRKKTDMFKTQKY